MPTGRGNWRSGTSNPPRTVNGAVDAVVVYQAVVSPPVTRPLELVVASHVHLSRVCVQRVHA